VPEELFAALYTDTAALAAPGVDDVRTRARRHTHRRRIVTAGATFAVLVVVAGGVAYAGRGTGPEPAPPPLSSAEASPSPAASPAPSAVPPSSPPASPPSSPGSSPARPPLTEIPPAALLRPEELGFLPSATTRDNSQEESGDGTLPARLNACPAFPSGPGGKAREVDSYGRRFSQGTASELQLMYLEATERDARTRFDWLREGARACANFVSEYDGTQVQVFVTQLSAGDRSFTVTIAAGERTETFVVVQVGRMITEFGVSGEPVNLAGTAAQKAADRMRAAQR